MPLLKLKSNSSVIYGMSYLAYVIQEISVKNLIVCYDNTKATWHKDMFLRRSYSARWCFCKKLNKSGCPAVCCCFPALHWLGFLQPQTGSCLPVSWGHDGCMALWFSLQADLQGSRYDLSFHSAGIGLCWIQDVQGNFNSFWGWKEVKSLLVGMPDGQTQLNFSEVMASSSDLQSKWSSLCQWGQAVFPCTCRPCL